MKKLVVITGASSGFGKALAERFSQAGYPLLLIARRVHRLEAMQLDNAICRKVDVTDYDAFEAAVREAEAVYGETDLLINNAGCMWLGDLGTQDRTQWQRMLDVNVMGVMNGMQIVMEHMKKAQHGTIINVSSVAGVNPYIDHATYCATKYGVNGLSEVARRELSPHNVRVIRVCPGAVKTEILDQTTDETVKANYEKWREEMGIAITTDDIAKTIQFAYEMPQTVTLREIQITDTKQSN